MRNFLLRVSCGFCVLMMVFGFRYAAAFGAGAGDGTVGASGWSDWTSVTSPASTFWGNIGNWTAAGSSYTGLGSGFTAVYSYTSLDSFGTAIEAIPTMTNYRVRLVMRKPASLDPYPKLIAGGKTSYAVGSSKPLQIDIRSWGIDVNQFGNTTWHSGNASIPWSSMVPGITAGTEFAFELEVTPEKIEFWVNGVSRYTVIPAASADIGLFGLAGVNTTATKGVTFSSIEYALYHTASDPGDPGASFSSSYRNQIEVSALGLSETDRFQVWIETKSPATDFKNSYYWVLAKAYDDLSGVTDGPDGSLVYEYNVPEDQWTPDGSYHVFYRVQDETGHLSFTEDATVSTIPERVVLHSVLIDGKPVGDNWYYESDGTAKSLTIRASASGDLTSGDRIYYRFLRSGISGEASGDSLDGWINLQDSYQDTCTFPIPAAGGSYSFRVAAYSLLSPEQNRQEKFFRLIIHSNAAPYVIITDPDIGNRATMMVGDRFALDFLGKTGGTGNDPKYKFSVGEAWKSTLLYQPYSSRSSFDEQITAPGVYEIRSFVSHSANTTFDDGLIQYTNVLRSPSDPVTGSAAIESCAVQINNKPVPDFDATYNPSSGASTPCPVSVLDYVAFSAKGTGLAGSGIDSSSYSWSFWRLDSSGYCEIKSWSPDGTLLWRPFAPGSYTILIRVKGPGAKSYEMQKAYRFDVAGVLGIGTLSFTIDKNSAVSADTVNPALARKPVVITANATGSPSVIYRFEIWDEYLGVTTLRGFAAQEQVTWYPRKAGTYRIIVRAQDVSSCGYGDKVLYGEPFLVR